jgi:hypothetical protein
MTGALSVLPVVVNCRLRPQAARKDKPVGGVTSLGASDDQEPPCFLVGEQKLVDLNRIIRGLVFILYEPRLVVAECQYPPYIGLFRPQFKLLSVNGDVQFLKIPFVLAG